MGEEDRRSEIFRRCLREAGYGVHSETVLEKTVLQKEILKTKREVRCKEGEVEVVLTKRDWEGITACAPLKQLKNPNSYYVMVRYEKVGKEWSPTIPKHNIDIRRSSKEVRAILKKTHPEWWRSPSERAHEGGNLHKMALTMEELQNELDRFTGTENYYRHFTGGKFTDGVKHLADRAGAYWLIDAIFSYQGEPVIKAVPFQIWTLKVLKSEIGKDKTEPMAVLEMRADTDHPVLVSQKIPFTDFPEGEFKLYYQNDVLFLPSEY